MEALVALGLLALNAFGLYEVTTRENYYPPPKDKTAEPKTKP